MAIKVVKQIPKPSHEQKTPAFSYTEKVLADISKAYKKRIAKFELIGYDNPTYLASCTHSLAYRFIKDTLYDPTERCVTEKLRERYKKSYGKSARYIRVTTPASSEPAIKVSGVTVNGVKRVFVEIDFDYIDNLETSLYDKAVAYYRKAETKTELKARLARDIRWKKMKTEKKKLQAG